MRKSFTVVFMCIAVLLTSCVEGDNIQDNDSKPENNKVTESQIIETSRDVKQENLITTKNSSDEQKTEINLNMKYMEEIRKAYSGILQDKKYLFEISHEIKKDDNFYKMPILVNEQNKPSLNESSGTSEIWFYENNDGIVDKSFEAIFTDKIDNSVIKEFIKVTLMALDSELDGDMAEEKVRLMVESTNNSPRSLVVNAGEYGVFFVMDMSNNLLTGGNVIVYAIHNSEINVKVNKEEYKKYSVEEMKAPLNKGEKAYITVTPYSYTDTPGQLMAKSKEGDIYLVYYWFNSFLTDFELDKTYTFYGTIVSAYGDILRFRVDYYEE